MATYVLVHGAWHGAWCWEKLAPLLEAEGHRVDALDLPGRGPNPAPIGSVTLESFARCVSERVEAAAEPVILVGHSMGGMSITQAAESVPDRISTLVYLAAFLPANGQSLVDLGGDDPGAQVRPNLVLNEQEGSCVLAEAAIRPAFYGECSDADAAAAQARLVPESLAVQVTPVAITAERASRVPRVYVECLRDRAITPGKQRQMYTALPCDQVITIDTDHSPFLSRPRELADHLLTLAA